MGPKPKKKGRLKVSKATVPRLKRTRMRESNVQALGEIVKTAVWRCNGCFLKAPKDGKYEPEYLQKFCKTFAQIRKLVDNMSLGKAQLRKAVTWAVKNSNVKVTDSEQLSLIEKVNNRVATAARQLSRGLKRKPQPSWITEMFQGTEADDAPKQRPSALRKPMGAERAPVEGGIS